VTGAAPTVLTAYGELNYNYPTRNPRDAQADVRRAVIGIQHRFDDKTKIVSEFEWEHAWTSPSSVDKSRPHIEARSKACRSAMP
jgi:hypothetical protein